MKKKTEIEKLNRVLLELLNKDNKTEEDKERIDTLVDLIKDLTDEKSIQNHRRVD